MVPGTVTRRYYERRVPFRDATIQKMLPNCNKRRIGMAASRTAPANRKSFSGN